MRLHHLTVTAFGPFAGTEEVDFEELNDAGLFLLAGPTGAGKSSLLDAVCFALYGTVPGVRGVKALKSQHSPADARPEVTLDLTVSGRRFVVRRSPEWTRPKRRGDGVVTEKAAASLVETTGGVERFLSSRAAEVGLQISALMGMNAGQFMQVALLPQGEFQTFLRASSQERHQVLQDLFRTDRFAHIEHWVDDRSRRLRETAQAGESRTRRVLHAVAERSGAHLPDRLGGDTLAVAAAGGEVLAWVRARVSEAETARLASERRVTGARSALTAARRRHDDAVRQAERSRRAEAARAVLADLAASADEAARADAALDAHERAQRCAPVVNALDRAQAACVDAPDVDALLADLLAPLGGDAAMVAADGPPLARASSALSTVDRAVGEARDRITRLEALLPRERGAVTVQQELAVARSSLDSAQHHERRLSSRAAHLPPEIARCATALEAASVRAGRVEALRVQLAAARERRDAAAERDQLRVELVAAEDARRDARERLLDARDRVQALAARRLAGMAGELAAALVDGAPCQVCGSKEHPAPAGRAADAVTEQEQQHAEAVLAQQQACFDDADAGCARTRERFGALEAAAGGASIDQATSAARDLATRLSEAERAAVEQQVHDRELGALRDEQAAVARELAGLSAEVRRLQESVTAREAVLAEVRHEVAAALAAATTRGSAAVGVDAADETPVSAAVSVERDLLQRLVEGRRALQRCEEAASLAETLAAEASLTALDHGFDGLDQVRRCLLSGPETERLRELLATRAAAQAHARSVLEELGTSDAQPAAETDLARLDGALAAAEQEATVAAGELAVRSESVTALRAHLDDLCEVLDEWAPVRDEALRAESMSRLVRGLGHENRLQMRLSAYVLATRLDQVVAAANERLASMRDQRYLLQRTGRAERKGSRAGLGLEVVDQWTGEVRAPTTLSGGETFVVSLALALGLADVVTHESGGTDVQTLFVDEGFGSLDAETLDDVMDRLDALRSGGRTVGVVSHVAELRGRIATRVEVLKGRSGSTVALRTLAG